MKALLALIPLIGVTVAQVKEEDHNSRPAAEKPQNQLVSKRESSAPPTVQDDSTDPKAIRRDANNMAWYGARPTPNRFVDVDLIAGVPSNPRRKADSAYIAIPQFNTSYYQEPVFWEGRSQSCSNGRCGYESFPFLKNPRPASYCEDRCWNNECLGRNCPGCEKECPRIFPGCDSKCFSEACIVKGDCGSHCWDCGKFMQYRWEKNLFSLRDRFAREEEPAVAFDQGFKSCGTICKKPAPGCEVCFERPKIGCSSCLERPTPECETCVTREVKRSQIPSLPQQISPQGFQGFRGAGPFGGAAGFPGSQQSYAPPADQGDPGFNREYNIPSQPRYYDQETSEHSYVDPYRGYKVYENDVDRSAYEPPFNPQKEFPFYNERPQYGNHPQNPHKDDNPITPRKGGCPNSKHHKKPYPPGAPCPCEEDDEEIVVEILPPFPKCEPSENPIINGFFEDANGPFYGWTPSSATGVSIATQPTYEGGNNPSPAPGSNTTYHSAEFNLDNDGCTATLTQPSLVGLCPNQHYALSMFLAVDGVAAHAGCTLQVILARQIFYRQTLPYPNVAGSLITMEYKLHGPKPSDLQTSDGRNNTKPQPEGVADAAGEGYRHGDPSDFTIRVECHNMTNTELARVWVDAISLSPI